MPDSPSEIPAEAPQPTDDPEVLVGDVNTSFEPLKPEDIAPAMSDSAADVDQPAMNDAGDNDNDAPPPLAVAPASSDKWLFGCLRDILLVLISIILGAAFTLSILLGLNSTLFLNDREKTAYLEVSLSSMQSQQEALSNQMQTQQDAIVANETQVKELKGQVQTLTEGQQTLSRDVMALQARADEIEQAAEAARQEAADLQASQDALKSQVAGLNDQIDGIQEDIAKFEKTAARFDKFVKGLVALIAEVEPQEMDASKPESTSAVTPAATPAAGAPITSTATITPTATLSPTVTTTPAVERPLENFPPLRPLPTPANGRGIIFGLVWLDANGNGLPEAGETALPGARISLQDANGKTLLNMITGVDGRFIFINVPPGDYQVQAAPPAGQVLDVPASRAVTVAADESVEINFGLTQP